MILLPSNIQVYLAPGITDMRKSINTLSLMVETGMNLNPLSGHLFVFCNKKKNIIKILYWDRNGFCLWQKRLGKESFRWPDSEKNISRIEERALGWLLNGLDLYQIKAHKSLSYLSVS